MALPLSQVTLRPYPRQVDTFVPIVGQPNRRPMPMGTTISRHLGRLTGTLQISVAAATSLIPDQPYSLIRDLQILLNAGYPLRSHPMRFQQFWNQYQGMTLKRSTPISSTAIGTYNFAAEFELPYSQMDLFGL